MYAYGTAMKVFTYIQVQWQCYWYVLGPTT